MGRRVNPGDHIKDGGLASAVGPDHAQDFALMNLEIEIVNGGQTAEIFGQGFCF